jgi:hypothetical protein
MTQKEEAPVKAPDYVRGCERTTTMTLPAEVDRVVTRYLALVDAAAPGVVEGLYLVGSVALDDFHPRSSEWTSSRSVPPR